VALILSYHPSQKFDAWFTGELLAGTSGVRTPTVFLAGYESDLRRLAPAALEVVALGPLPEEPAAEFLRTLNEKLTAKLNARELQDYLALIRRDPAAIPALQGLLELELEADRP